MAPNNKRWRRPQFRGQKKRKIEPTAAVGTHEELLALDIRSLLDNFRSVGTAIDGATAPDETADSHPVQLQQNVTLPISAISSTGDGLALAPDGSHVYVVPSTYPGDIATFKPFKHVTDSPSQPPHSLTDFISISQPAKVRDDSLVKCQYFTRCSGCQLQYLPYEEQLQFKRNIVEKAYKNFSHLAAGIVPEIGDTFPSPLQYGYRTKLTPHFDGPRKGGFKPGDEENLDIGFQVKGRRSILDIEDCPISTDALRQGLVERRAWVKANLHQKYKTGATVLLRESTTRTPQDGGGFTESKSCIFENNAISTEYVGDYRFDNLANSFFQNNNSILPGITDYIRKAIASTLAPPKYLVDAYCGSGLFSITLSSSFEESVGIDIATDGIEYAKRNAKLSLPESSKLQFLAGKAEKIFDNVRFDAAQTAVIIDPPRKGCDELFLEQLVRFGPSVVVYVSCNVHTQARDVGWLLGGEASVEEHESREDDQQESGGEAQHSVKVQPVAGASTSTQKDAWKGKYKLESVKGFDFFPQTAHVESVAILRRIEA